MASSFSVAPVSYHGGKNSPFADSSADGDLVGENSAVTVEIVNCENFSEEGDYCVVLSFNDDDENVAEKYFSSGQAAIRFGELLLAKVNDPMYDLRKVAVKYAMRYTN